MIIKTILINNNYIDISNENIRKIYDKREWKTIIFTKYEQNKFIIRDKIYVTFDKQENIKKGDEIELKSSYKTILGKGKYLAEEKINGQVYNIINDLEIYLDNNYYKDPTALFRLFNDEELKKRHLNYQVNESEKSIKEKYQKGLFKIYYNLLNYSITYLSENIEGKYSALCSYLAVKDVFSSYGIILSNHNCFIKGYKNEYDALILKHKDNKYFYSESELLATIELKVSGCFYKQPSIKSNFKKYLKEQHGNLHIPHIYITLHESSANGSKMPYYETCKEAIEELNDDYIGIFCTIKNNNERFIIPIDYDLDNILKKITTN